MLGHDGPELSLGEFAIILRSFWGFANLNWYSGRLLRCVAKMTGGLVTICLYLTILVVADVAWAVERKCCNAEKRFGFVHDTVVFQ